MVLHSAQPQAMAAVARNDPMQQNRSDCLSLLRPLMLNSCHRIKNSGVEKNKGNISLRAHVCRWPDVDAQHLGSLPKLVAGNPAAGFAPHHYLTQPPTPPRYINVNYCCLFDPSQNLPSSSTPCAIFSPSTKHILVLS